MIKSVHIFPSFAIHLFNDMKRGQALEQNAPGAECVRGIPVVLFVVFLLVSFLFFHKPFPFGQDLVLMKTGIVQLIAYVPQTRGSRRISGSFTSPSNAIMRRARVSISSSSALIRARSSARRRRCSLPKQPCRRRRLSGAMFFSGGTARGASSRHNLHIAKSFRFNE